MCLICLLGVLTLWAGYRFSVGHLDETMHLNSSAMPSFQHFPSPLRFAARHLVAADPLLPAPELLSGMAQAWVLNRNAPQTYLLGRAKSGRWWYSFLWRWQ